MKEGKREGGRREEGGGEGGREGDKEGVEKGGGREKIEDETKGRQEESILTHTLAVNE